MIVERAPGKLYIAGEYAVVESGNPAILVALDRYLTVEVSPAQSVGTISSADHGQLELTWRRHHDDIVVENDHRHYAFVLSALRTVEQLVGERGLPPQLYDVSISSELDDPSGRKYGLGSSAAVTVATVRALSRLYGLGLDDSGVYKTAMLASMRISPSLSGGDVAASSVGGWILYSAPDRRRVLEQWRRWGVDAAVREPWAGLHIESLPAPARLTLYVGWTGSPASTEGLVSGVQRRKALGGIRYDEFVRQSTQCVTALAEGFRRDDAETVLAQITRARHLLAMLADQSGLVIETGELATLCDSAEAVGASAKSSGAGGGDCGIALARSETDVGAMLTAWEQHDIRRLPLAVHENECQTGSKRSTRSAV